MLFLKPSHLHKMSIEEQLTVLRRANNEMRATNPNWDPISEEDFARLAVTAPKWPKGRYSYRSFRIRFGEGDEGVIRTFAAHWKRIQQIFGETATPRCEILHSCPMPFKNEPVKRLRLSSGNHTHKPVVEWAQVKLSTHNPYADELLVLIWMFPNMICEPDNPQLVANGYEVNVPEYDASPWQGRVVCHFSCIGRMNVFAGRRGDGSVL